VCSIRIFAKNIGDPYYEPTIVVHDKRHTTQALHLLWLIESRINNVCWVKCLHLVLSRAWETQHKHCIYCQDSLKVEQTVLIYIAINWVECLRIADVGETHNTSTAASTVTHWKWSKQYWCLLLLLSGVPALSIIAAYQSCLLVALVATPLHR